MAIKLKGNSEFVPIRRGAVSSVSEQMKRMMYGICCMSSADVTNATDVRGGDIAGIRGFSFVKVSSIFKLEVGGASVTGVSGGGKAS